MFKNILPVFMLCVMALAMASCLEDEKTELVYYDDTAVTGFSLGTLNSYTTVKTAAGADSIVKSTVDASSYTFKINNATHRIYNVDSLPVGVDVTKVVCNITTKNSGVPLWQYKASNGNDSLAYYSSTDSLDFSDSLNLRVYNTSVTAYRLYTVKLNVHKEVADSFVWRQLEGNVALAGLRTMKMVSVGNEMYVVGFDGSATKVYAANRSGYAGFAESNATYGADAYRNVAVMADKLYMLDGTTLKCLTDGTVTENVPVARLLGAGNNRLYACNAEGNIVASADTKTWTPCAMDGNKALLPAENVNLLALQSKTNADAYMLSLVGNVADSCHAIVWGKVEEGLEVADTQPWNQYEVDVRNHCLPAMANMQTFVYGRSLVAVGSGALNGSTAKGIDTMYSSQDAGLTWQLDSTLTLPKEFALGNAQFAMTVDADNFVWLVGGDGGMVWRGRLNKLGWAVKE